MPYVVVFFPSPSERGCPQGGGVPLPLQRGPGGIHLSPFKGGRGDSSLPLHRGPGGFTSPPLKGVGGIKNHTPGHWLLAASPQQTKFPSTKKQAIGHKPSAKSN